VPWDVRRGLLRAARRGDAYGDSVVAGIAIGWAWEVIGPPWARREKNGAPEGLAADVGVLLLTGALALRPCVLNGAADHDRTLLVRTAAGLVESSNYGDIG
jgi:hypothetical protein